MIIVAKSYDEVLDVIIHYSGCFTSFRTGQVQPHEIAEKLTQFGTVLELVEDGIRIGFSAFYHNDNYKKQAYLSLIAVLQEYAGLGYGASLLNEVERISKNSGMLSILLEVRKDNIRAISFYQKNNYAFASQNGNENLLMLKELR